MDIEGVGVGAGGQISAMPRFRKRIFAHHVSYCKVALYLRFCVMIGKHQIGVVSEAEAAL